MDIEDLLNKEVTLLDETPRKSKKKKTAQTGAESVQRRQKKKKVLGQPDEGPRHQTEVLEQPDEGPRHPDEVLEQPNEGPRHQEEALEQPIEGPRQGEQLDGASPGAASGRGSRMQSPVSKGGRNTSTATTVQIRGAGAAIPSSLKGRSSLSPASRQSPGRVGFTTPINAPPPGIAKKSVIRTLGNRLEKGLHKLAADSEKLKAQ